MIFCFWKEAEGKMIVTNTPAQFMIEVASLLGCIPDLVEPSLETGNTHIKEKLLSLIENEKRLEEIELCAIQVADGIVNHQIELPTNLAVAALKLSERLNDSKLRAID